MFRLLRYYSFSSGLALLAVALVLTAVYRNNALDSLVDAVEKENVTMSRAFANAIWTRFADYVTLNAPRDKDALKARPETTEIHDIAKGLVAGLSVVKIKIYRLDGLTVYSSDFSDIGADESHNPDSTKTAAKGTPANKFGFRKTFMGINGPLKDRYIIESYLPILGKSGAVEGVFELYSDATARVVAVTNDVK